MTTAADRAHNEEHAMEPTTTHHVAGEVTVLRAPMPRRTVLVAAAATGVLAACSSADADAPTTSATASASAPTGGGGGTVLAATADIPVGGGVVLGDRKLVVTQPTAGQFKAFSAVCPHQGCLVSRVTDNEIVCPCHSSKFSADTGDVEQGPAAQGLATVAVVVEGGNVVEA